MRLTTWVFRCVATASCIALSVAVPAQAPASAAFPSNEQLRHYRSLSGMALSPDALHVAVRLSDSTADGAKGHLWLLDTRGGPPRQLTYSPETDKRGEAGPQWSPDGQTLLFLAKRGEHTQLFRLPMSGGEAKPFDLKVTPVVDASKGEDALPPPDPKQPNPSDEPLKPVPLDVASYRISPDGATIAIVAHDPQTPGEKKSKDAKADATWVDHEVHRDRLYLLNTASEKLTPVSLEANVRGGSWSSDSKRLVAVTDEPNGVDELGPAASAWLLSTTDPAHPKKLSALPNTVGPVAWSRNGDKLFFLAQARQDAPPGVLGLYEHTLDANTTTDLSTGLLGSLGRSEPLPLIDGGVLQIAEEDLESNLLRYTSGKPEHLKLPFAVASEVSTNEAQSGWVFAGSSGGAAPAVMFTPRLGDLPRQLQIPDLVPTGVRSQAPKRLAWRSDKLTIHGLLYLPPDAATRKVPLVVEVHGGPTGYYNDSFCSFCDFLLGHGWAVLRTNPRGSSGRGEAFAAANKNDLGGGDLRDILSGVDFVLKTEPLDPAKLALMGYSYGGEMAGFVETRTTRFKAIISMAPVIDQNSEYGTERGSWYDQWFYGKPWEHEADAWRQSPLSGVAQARTPFMLLQGDDDSTDPLGQSQEMYRALRQMHVPVDLITYPRVDHGPLAQAIYGAPSPEPWHGFDARQRIVAFLRKAFGELAK